MSKIIKCICNKELEKLVLSNTIIFNHECKKCKYIFINFNKNLEFLYLKFSTRKIELILCSELYSGFEFKSIIYNPKNGKYPFQSNEIFQVDLENLKDFIPNFLSRLEKLYSFQ